MSPEKKVLFLFLSLLVLMGLCVYTHVDTIKVAGSTIEKEQIPEPILVEESKPKIADDASSKEEKSNEEVVQEVKEDSSSLDNEDKKEQTEENIEAQTLEEEKPEVIEEPLLTTGEKYIREGSEKRIEELSRDTQELQIELSKYIKDNPIIFQRASNKITKSSNKSIKKIVEVLKEFPNIKIEIAGHTDAVGSNEVNAYISLERAKAVMKRLRSNGISKDRMKARGYGEDIPLVKNSPKGYSKVNRRVEFNIVEE